MPTKKPTARTFLATVEDRPGVLNRVVSLIRRRGYNIESLAVGTTETPSVSRITLVVRADEDTARRVLASLLKLVDVLRVDDVSNSPSVIHEMALVKVLAPDHQRNEVLRICEAFRARIVDLSPATVVLEITGGQDRIEGLLEVLRPFGVAEVVRTGAIAMLRGGEAVRYAREFFDDVEYSAEDAARTEPDFLAEVVERAVAAGATTINIPDTVGYALPAQFGALIGHLRKTVRGIDRVVLSVHCHNDLGLAVANTLSAIEAGARQVECTVNGIGERAGNCSLEEVVMAVHTRADHFGLRTSIRTAELVATSRIVSEATGFLVQRNKAVVGENAFAHEAGIHQHGMLRHAQTYEIMRPEDVGFPSTRLVLGKHSGRHVLRKRLEDLGHEIDAQTLDRAFDELKRLADRRKEVHDVDLEAIMRRIAPVEARP